MRSRPMAQRPPPSKRPADREVHAVAAQPNAQRRECSERGSAVERTDAVRPHRAGAPRTRCAAAQCATQARSRSASQPDAAPETSPRHDCRQKADAESGLPAKARRRRTPAPGAQTGVGSRTIADPKADRVARQRHRCTAPHPNWERGRTSTSGSDARWEGADETTPPDVPVHAHRTRVVGDGDGVVRSSRSPWCCASGRRRRRGRHRVRVPQPDDPHRAPGAASIPEVPSPGVARVQAATARRSRHHHGPFGTRRHFGHSHPRQTSPRSSTPMWSRCSTTKRPSRKPPCRPRPRRLLTVSARWSGRTRRFCSPSTCCRPSTWASYLAEFGKRCGATPVGLQRSQRGIGQATG